MATRREPKPSPITGHAPPASGRWKPGQSGNPKGRPVSIVRKMEQRLRSLGADGKREIVDAVVDTMLRAMLRDPVKAWPMLKDLIDRLDGPIRKEVELTGPDGGPLQVTQPNIAEFGERLRRMAEAGEREKGAAE